MTSAAHEGDRGPNLRETRGLEFRDHFPRHVTKQFEDSSAILRASVHDFLILKGAFAQTLTEENITMRAE